MDITPDAVVSETIEPNSNPLSTFDSARDTERKKTGVGIPITAEHFGALRPPERIRGADQRDDHREGQREMKRIKHDKYGCDGACRYCNGSGTVGRSRRKCSHCKGGHCSTCKRITRKEVVRS